jgi:hypothetical protein
MKKCVKCGVEKSINEFPSNQRKTLCKKCESLYNKEYNLKNKTKKQEYSKQYREKNKETIKQYWHGVKHKYIEQQKHTIRSYQKDKYKLDPFYKLKHNTRNLIYISFKKLCLGKYKKGKKTEQILGCTVKEFIQHLQNQFTEGMTLENHGKGQGYWNIDHIIPISSAKTEEEIYKLNHYTNFQPLWWEENMAKGKKIL